VITRLDALSDLSNGQLIGGGAIIAALALVLLAWALAKRLLKLAFLAAVILAAVVAYRVSTG
jgi:hypothetical protein